jgi:CO/xanthine dehydrogenase Mo-binding subunit
VSAPRISRRGVLAGAGALVVSFALAPRLLAQGSAGGAALPGSLAKTPLLDSWIRVGADGRITVFTGKAELGQGIRTALLQVAAEELDVAPAAVTLVTADTMRTPDEGYTAGSHSMQDSGAAIRAAAAEVRAILVARAAERLGVAPETLETTGGAVVAGDGRSLSYGALVADETLHVAATGAATPKDPARHAVVGKALARVDIPGKLAGTASYVQDLRLPGMVHGRVVRPDSPGASLAAVETARVERMPGVVGIVRDGSFLAVVAKREYTAVAAMRALAEEALWEEGAALPAEAAVFDLLQRASASSTVILDRPAATAPAAKTLEARYRRPYQMHGSIGPSCAVAQLKDETLTIWTHSQGVFPLRRAIAEMLGMPEERVRCVHMEGSGCYGHNGADDVAADAALLARAVPGRPVRVQWMREEEHTSEPYGPAMASEARAALDAEGNIVDWDYAVWSNTHSTRPGGAGQLLAARSLERPFAPPPPRPIPQPEGGGDRNAIPLYALPRARVVSHFVPEMPLRVSALRALGAYMNVFAIESFMDELAHAAGLDPVAFRLRHLGDPRGREVLTTAAERFDWEASTRLAPGRGRGIAFARYKNLAAYAAIAVEVEVERESGRVRLLRAVAAVDSGEAVNPDGIRNQIEGAILQSSSWTLYEAVRFEERRIVSRDWASYPILRFGAVPERVEVHVIDRPGAPFLGTGEAGQGPTAAAIANAVADATGARIRELPLTADRVKAAIGV